jgi:hypothetical protein
VPKASNFAGMPLEERPESLPVAKLRELEGADHAFRAAGRTKGMETGLTIARSVRLPASVWRHLEGRAKAEGLALHAAIRAAVMAWVNK